MYKNLKLSTWFLLGVIGAINCSQNAFAVGSLTQQVGFVNLTTDTIQITNISSSHCTHNLSGVFTGGSVTLDPQKFTNTSDATATHQATPNLASSRVSYDKTIVGPCDNKTHSEELALYRQDKNTGQFILVKDFYIYLPINHTASGHTSYGGLSFNHDDAFTVLSFTDSEQMANVTPDGLKKYPYFLQIQGSHLGNDGSDRQQPIIYIYPNDNYDPS